VYYFYETHPSSSDDIHIVSEFVLKEMRLSSLAYGIVYINKSVTQITNEVLTSKHECRFNLPEIDLHLPKRLGNCKLFTESCSEHPSWGDYTCDALFYTKQSHRLFGEPQCHCKLCVKDGSASLKSLYVNKICEFTFYPIPLRKRNYSKCKKICISKFEGF